MFILQTDLPNYYNFQTNISKEGGIEFYTENRKQNIKIYQNGLKKSIFYVMKRKNKKISKLKQIHKNQKT